MRARSGCRGLAALAVALASGAAARAQLLTPNTTVVVPPVGRARVETEYSLLTVESFVDLSGQAQRFPGSLDFALAVLRVSYSPWRNVAIGIEQPYRRSTFDEPGIEASFVAQGAPGFGMFFDWSPGGDRPRRWRPVARLEYFRARSESDQVLTVSDGANRYAATFGLSRIPRPGTSSWRGGATLQLVWGPPMEAEGRFLESRLQVEAGHPVMHLLGGELSGFGLAGYRSSTSARQEGMFFHDRTSQGAFAGARVDWRPPARLAHVPEVRASVVKDVRPRNALFGWRTTISLALTF